LSLRIDELKYIDEVMRSIIGEGTEGAFECDLNWHLMRAPSGGKNQVSNACSANA
jgi:hypothetical protein